MSKKRTIAMIVIVIAVILISGSIYIINWKTELTKYGYKVPTEINGTLIASSGNWTGVGIDNDIKYTDGAHNIVPYDIDGDGEMELIANSYRSDTLMFYKYDVNPHDPLNWTRYVIDFSVGAGNPRRPAMTFIKSMLKEKLLGGSTGGAHYTAIDDMNGDGLDDLIVAGDLKNYDVVWYETPMEITNVSLWRKHYVYKNDSHRTYHVEAGDIDGDGDLDIVVADEDKNMVIWFENSDITSYENWKAHVIDESDHYLKWCHDVELGDIDGDGNLDIAVAAAGSNTFLYYYANK